MRQKPRGKEAHATELIAKAVLAHRTVLQEIVCIPDLSESKRELAREARRLLESIQSIERQFRILCCQLPELPPRKWLPPSAAGWANTSMSNE